MTLRSMSMVWVLGGIALVALIILAIAILAPFDSIGVSNGQADETTEFQGTVDAAVSNLFTQTAEAPYYFQMTQAVGTAFANALTATAQVGAAAPAATDTPAPVATEPPATNTPTATAPAAAPTETPTPDLFPTDIRSDLDAAFQQFETGYMFWLRPNRQIWVAFASAGDPNSGDWYCYNDTFEEGEPETDPSLIPPDGLYQPRRGFGKLWRLTDGMRDRLGWATTPEQELLSPYRYVHGGTIENGTWVPGAGEHHLTTFDGDPITFFELEQRGDCIGGTWQLGG